MSDVILIGLAELEKKLASVKDSVKGRGAKFAGRKAAKVIAARLRQNAEGINDPNTNESIAKNIAVNADNRYMRRTGNLKFRVGIVGGAKQYGDTVINRRKRRVGKTYADGGTIAKKGGGPGGDTWYWRLVEFGTARTKAKPFMRRSLSETTQEATTTFVEEYKKTLDRAIKRAEKNVS